jgi:very-short-patch-repair endonuclease
LKKKRTKKEVDVERLQQFLNRMAKKLRGNRTKWEQSFYITLKSLGYKFEFQKPIICREKYGYILDFLLSDFNIVVEIDGKSTHGSKEQQKKDNQRSRRIKKEGFHILRFWNSQVSVFTKEQVDQIIKQKISLIKSEENE